MAARCVPDSQALRVRGEVMKITLTTHDGVVHEMRQPFDGSDWVKACDGVACDHCGSPLRATGKGQSIESHDTYRADAVCASEACGEPIGVLRVKVSTIFGIEEDQRVMNGRCRVY